MFSKWGSIIGFFCAILALVVFAFGGAFVAERLQNDTVKKFFAVLTAIDLLVLIYFVFVIFVSVMSIALIRTIGIQIFQEKSEDPLYFFQWREIREQFDRQVQIKGVDRGRS